jgi:hypothetical protein
MSQMVIFRLLPEILLLMIVIALSSSAPVPTDIRDDHHIDPSASATVIPSTSTILESGSKNIHLHRTKRWLFYKMLVELIIRDGERSKSTTHAFPIPRLPTWLG